LKEIERKFLVDQKLFPGSENRQIIRQGYLSLDPERIVRIRTEGEQAWITVKGKIEGFTRPEYEYRIPVSDAREMLGLSVYPPVEKIRHRIMYEGTLWEVDEFLGSNSGLFLAEVELDDEGQDFTAPAWIGKEVTDDRRYYNSYLSNHPYSGWETPA
jgi:CYTH domain-containing protein